MALRAPSLDSIADGAIAFQKTFEQDREQQKRDKKTRLFPVAANDKAMATFFLFSQTISCGPECNNSNHGNHDDGSPPLPPSKNRHTNLP